MRSTSTGRMLALFLTQRQAQPFVACQPLIISILLLAFQKWRLPSRGWNLKYCELSLDRSTGEEYSKEDLSSHLPTRASTSPERCRGEREPNHGLQLSDTCLTKMKHQFNNEIKASLIDDWCWRFRRTRGCYRQWKAKRGQGHVVFSHPLFSVLNRASGKTSSQRATKHD